jgi:hypothetical protein
MVPRIPCEYTLPSAIDEVLEPRTAGKVKSLGDEKGVEEDDSRRTVILSSNVYLFVSGRLIGMIGEKLLESDDDADLSIWGCADFCSRIGVEPMGNARVCAEKRLWADFWHR